MEGRVQRIANGIDAAHIWDDWRILQAVANALGAGWSYRTSDSIFADLAKAVPAYAAAAPAQGRVLWGDR